MKIISFNVNGIRARIHQLKFIIKKYQPDIIGLQETKVANEDFPLDELGELGYHISYFGQKTHYGVAILSLVKPNNTQKGFINDDPNAQRRLIISDYHINGLPLKVINGYFPQGENRNHPVKFPEKLKFYANLQNYLNVHCLPSDNLVVIGDFNISATDQDIGIGDDNKKRWLRSGKCSFLPEERECFSRLENWGLFDCFRILNPTVDDCYTWFDYRSKGFDKEPKRGLRIDSVLATRSLLSLCKSVVVDYQARAMDKPSDHAPIIATF
ncbi:exodeoxyribonuclease III [Endozoicomonas sp. Mp262]|uniref:exodeoxyribonuclease III n=1 Tax=Endozoicomonas sp. Mp262 TaxID=2919499 RepID=UPI0021D8B575